MNEIIRMLVDARQNAQKMRIAFGNRISAIERGVDIMDKTHYDKIENFCMRFQMLEENLDDEIRAEADTMPIISLMCELKGVKEILAAKVACMIDIKRAETVSDLWRYAGFGVIDGARERLKAGELSHHNKRLKIACLLVGGSFLKCNSPYRAEYDQAREHYDSTHPEWTKLHKHHAAIDKMVKLWLQHLWITWRKLEGLPISLPYIFETDGNHHHYKPPESYGWPMMEMKEKRDIKV